MSWDDLLAAAARIREVAVARDPSLAGLPLAGIGWATVDAERALDELDAALATDRGGGAESPVPWAPLDRDPLLGARVWLRATAGAPRTASVPTELWLVVLEPDTEGRLAASLARFGEGVAVAYLGEGSIRPVRLVRGGPVWGPHVVILGAAGDPE